MILLATVSLLTINVIDATAFLLPMRTGNKFGRVSGDFTGDRVTFAGPALAFSSWHTSAYID